jgi:phosphate-selective porin OprO/OprP
MEFRRFDQWDRHVPAFVVVAIALMALGLPAEAQEPAGPTGPRAGAGQDAHGHGGDAGPTVVGEDIEHRAWQVAASWVLTGENATDAGAGIRPRAEFGNGSWGAVQIAARYHAIALDAQAVSLGLASAGSSRKAEAWTGGLNWYLTRNVRNTINVERTVFDDDPDGPRPAENAVAFRTQVSF